MRWRLALPSPWNRQSPGLRSETWGLAWGRGCFFFGKRTRCAQTPLFRQKKHPRPQADRIISNNASVMIGGGLWSYPGNRRFGKWWWRYPRDWLPVTVRSPICPGWVVKPVLWGVRLACYQTVILFPGTALSAATARSHFQSVPKNSKNKRSA